MSKTRKQRGRGHGRPGSSKQRMNVNHKSYRKSHRHFHKPGHVSPRTMYALRATVPANQRRTLKAWKRTSPRTKALQERKKQENAAKAAKAQQEKSYMISMARRTAKNTEAARVAKEKHDRQMRILRLAMERDTRADRLPEVRAKAESAVALLRAKKNSIGIRGMNDVLMALVADHNYNEIIAMLSGLSVHNGPSLAAASASAAASALPARRERSMADVLAGRNNNDD